ncbi:hypothetical protein GH733_008106 [Mirounga leonina]|nr:hypothetical protein GH733_008106 [Mirounga leonina]
MTFIYDLQSATKLCSLFVFWYKSLTNWRKCNTLAVTSLDCHQVQTNHIVNKCQGLEVNTLQEKCWVEFLHFAILTRLAPVLLVILKSGQKLFAIIVHMQGHKGMVVSTSSEGEGKKEKKKKLFFGLSSCGLLFVVFYFTWAEVSPAQEGTSYSY